MNSETSSDVVFDVSVVLLAGVVVFGGGVTAGRGKVVDWRSVKCGENVLESGDAYDVAACFVGLVGEHEARRAVQRARLREVAE